MAEKTFFVKVNDGVFSRIFRADIKELGGRVVSFFKDGENEVDVVLTDRFSVVLKEIQARKTRKTLIVLCYPESSQLWIATNRQFAESVSRLLPGRFFAMPHTEVKNFLASLFAKEALPQPA